MGATSPRRGDSVNPGDVLPSRFLTVAAPRIAQMAEVLRDPNPIHRDCAAVMAAGLGDKVINQGPANLAYIIEMLLRALPGWRIRTLDSRYLANVRDEDRVEAGGVVTSVTAEEVTCDAWLKLGGGDLAVTAKATLAWRTT
jgi:3-hydroxybutyryl-CoA dehydratase